MTHKLALKAALKAFDKACDDHAEAKALDILSELEAAIAAYLEARGAVLVPEKMTMPMLHAVMKAHRSLPAGKQTIAASTEYQTAELVWDAALSALSDNPKGETP